MIEDMFNVYIYVYIVEIYICPGGPKILKFAAYGQFVIVFSCFHVLTM